MNLIVARLPVRVAAASGPVKLLVFFKDNGNSPQVDRVEFKGGYNVYAPP